MSLPQDVNSVTMARHHYRYHGITALCLLSLRYYHEFFPSPR